MKQEIFVQGGDDDKSKFVSLLLKSGWKSYSDSSDWCICKNGYTIGLDEDKKIYVASDYKRTTHLLPKDEEYLIEIIKK